MQDALPKYAGIDICCYTKGDIASFVKTKGDELLRRKPKLEEGRDKIVQSLTNGADGMFQWGWRALERPEDRGLGGSDALIRVRHFPKQNHPHAHYYYRYEEIQIGRRPNRKPRPRHYRRNYNLLKSKLNAIFKREIIPGLFSKL